jgi:hypothetical protein
VSQIDIELVIGAVTVIISLLGSAFIGGTKWGEVRAEMRFMNDRLAKIEGAFTFRPRDHDN